MNGKPYPLEPALLAFKPALTRGALVLLPAGKEKHTVLRFQYNPETISRTRTGTWESRKTGQDGKKTPAQDRAMDAFKGGGLFAKSETISIKLIFDATEMTIDPTVDQATKDLGVLPQLAVLERMGISEPPGKEDTKKKDTKLTSMVPKNLLLVLGPRAFPVIVTNMTINEKRFDTKLTPIRAEVDLALQVMEASEMQGQTALVFAYGELLAKRTEWANKGASSDSVIDQYVQTAMSGKIPTP